MIRSCKKSPSHQGKRCGPKVVGATIDNEPNQFFPYFAQYSFHLSQMAALF